MPAPVLVLFHLAFRTLVRSRISFVLLVLAVTAGLGFQIPNTANIDGYTKELRVKGITRDTGHVVVSSRAGGNFAEADALGASFAKEKFVQAVTVRLAQVGTAFLAEKSGSGRVVGVDAKAEQNAIGFCNDVDAGRCLAPGDNRHALLGSYLANTLGAHVGDSLRVVMPYFEGQTLRVAEVRFEVVGILRGAGGFRADYELFVPLSELRSILGQTDIASEIRVFTEDEDRATEWAKSIAAIAPHHKVEAWSEAHQFIKNAIDANRSISRISTAMVVVAVMIPVLALLYIHVLAERRRIATIAALGFHRMEIFVIHFLQAFFIGVIGCGLGSGVGYGLCLYFQKHPIFANSGFVVLPSITWHAFALPGITLFCTTLVAGIVPAMLAARAEPAMELRSE